MKDRSIAILLWFGFFFGLAGLHRLYLGRVGSGLLWLLTWGFLGVGQLLDLLSIGRMVDEANATQRPAPPPRVVERQVIREVVVKVRCPYCGALVDQGVHRCASCGGAV